MPRAGGSGCGLNAATLFLATINAAITRLAANTSTVTILCDIVVVFISNVLRLKKLAALRQRVLLGMPARAILLDETTKMVLGAAKNGRPSFRQGRALLNSNK